MRPSTSAPAFGRSAASFALLGLFAASAAGCHTHAPAQPACDVICKVEADCSKVCDPVEDPPDCSEAEKYREAYDSCRAVCDGGLTDRGAPCDAAVDAYSACIDGPVCGDQSGCDIEGGVYHERCVGQPGDISCFSVCSGLEIGCVPYESLGVRGGDDCETVCAESAEDSVCMNSLFVFDECLDDHSGSGYSCTPEESACDDEIADVEGTCDAFEEVTGTPADRAFCAPVADTQCACAFWSDPAEPTCEEQAENECVYELGWGLACRDAIEAFAACMESLDVCTRETVRELCIDEWLAWNDACQV